MNEVMSMIIGGIITAMVYCVVSFFPIVIGSRVGSMLVQLYVANQLGYAKNFLCIWASDARNHAWKFKLFGNPVYLGSFPWRNKLYWGGPKSAEKPVMHQLVMELAVLAYWACSEVVVSNFSNPFASMYISVIMLKRGYQLTKLCKQYVASNTDIFQQIGFPSKLLK